MPNFPVLRLLPATLLVLLTSHRAAAMGLGDATVRSTLGAPLRVEIAVRTAPDEVPDEQCISLAPIAGSDPTVALGLRSRLVPGPRTRLVVESARPVTEPFANLRVRLDCGGAALVRDYALLIDPAPGAASAPLFTAAGQLAAEAPSASKTSGSAVAPNKTADGSGKRHRRHRAHGDSDGDGASIAPRAYGPVSASRLRLDLGGSAASLPPGASLRSAASPGTLRLDPSFAPPGAVTTDLVAERERLREMRTLLLTEDNPVERLLLLQTQVNTLDGQLRALQGKSPVAPGAPVTSSGSPVLSPLPATPADAGARPPAHPEAVGVKLQPGTGDDDLAMLGLWATAALGVGLLGAGALLLLRRRQRSAQALPALDSTDQDLASALLAGVRRTGKTSDRRSDDMTGTDAPVVSRRSKVAVPGSGRRVVPERKPAPERTDASDSAKTGNDGQPTEPGDANLAARTAYLAARFPELAAGLIQLHDPDSVVAGARLYVDHNDHDRANELLEVAVQGPCENDVRPWLALFELHRLRQEASPYAVLLARFRARFVASRYIPEILAVGRQLDPGREEFQAPEGSMPVIVTSEGTTWLNPELDFVPQALAQELHDNLMAEIEDDGPWEPSSAHQPAGDQAR